MRILESGAPLADGALFDRAVVFTAAVDGGNGAPFFDATIDGRPYTLGDSYAVEGTHAVEVTATSGPDSATASARFTIDLSPPVFDQVDPPNGALLGGAVVTVIGPDFG